MWFGELEKDEKIFIASENIKWREETIMWKTRIGPKNYSPLKSKQIQNGSPPFAGYYTW
jgi:hypothetical protein